MLAVGAVLWLLPMGALLAWQGWHGALTQMGWFFTKAALLTFGGAYAVLPYVYQGAVEQFGWLTGPQMIDGLALGETTPGPLIMVVAFVAFVGGWTQEVLGPGRAVPGRGAGGAAGDLVHLPALLHLHPGRRAAGGVHPRQAAFHRAAGGHHRRGGRRDCQSCSVFHSACRFSGGGCSRFSFECGVAGAWP